MQQGIVLDFQYIQKARVIVKAGQLTGKEIVIETEHLEAATAQGAKLGGERACELVVVEVQEFEAMEGMTAIDPVVGKGTGELVAAEIQVGQTA